jgi:hypothetical protein
MTMISETFNAEDLGRCPCGAKIYADTKRCAVVHEEPVCSPFMELEPDEFLTFVRRSRGLPDPSAPVA